MGGKARAVLRARFGEEVYGSWFHLMEFESFDQRVADGLQQAPADGPGSPVNRSPM